MSGLLRRFGSFLVALIALAAVFGARALADPPDSRVLDVTHLRGGVVMLRQLEVLEDRDGLLTLEDVRQPFRNAVFRRALDEPSFGFTRSAVWVRFAVQNPSDRAQPWLLELPYSHLDNIDLYAVHPDGRVEHTVAGDILPFSARTVDVPTFVFPQETAPLEQTQFYLRTRSDGAVRIPLRAWLSLDFVAHETQHELVLWLFYGAVLVMICYNVGVAALLRNREYLLHVGLLASVGGAIFSLSGQSFQYLVPDHPQVANRILAVFIALGLLFVQLYSQEVAGGIPQLSRMMRLWYITLPPAILAVPLAMFHRLGLRAVFAVVGLYMPFAIYKMVCLYRLAVPHLRFYLLSFLALAVSIPVAMAAHAKLLPPWPINIWAAHIGCAVYAVLTALALPARINLMSDRVAKLNVQLSENVSDLRLALTRAEHATDEARRATKVKDEFMATMSHELRTPLNAIINVPQGLLEDFPEVRSATCGSCQELFLLEPNEQLQADAVCEACGARGTLRAGQSLQYTGDPAHTARFLHKIERSGQHLLQMVNGVLDFSKMEAGRLELQLAPLQLKALLSDAVDSMSDLAARRQLSLELVTTDAGEPCFADAVRIRQVLLNLLSNAIKFSEPGGKIVVTWQRDADTDTLSIKDQGIGIAREDHDRVFASFEQVHKGDTRKYGGTGLGLSISRSLVRMHGGELWVESALGQGSTFKFTLPRRQQSAPGHSSAA